MSETDEETTVKELLEALEQGADGALDRLVSKIYPDLKKLAHFQRAEERHGHSLNTTAIVHEAFIRLAGRDASYSDRSHFMRAAATVMRHLLVDHARARNADKRGGGIVPMTFQEDRAVNTDDTMAVLALDAAMNDIAAIDPRLEGIIECRYFAGLTVAETSSALGMSVRSVERGWQKARGYLITAMETGTN